MSIDPARTDVFAEERQQLIARLVDEHGRARVAELSSQFGVSSVTIRKDLEKLEQQGRLMRTHGGAVAPGPAGAERAFDVRERLQRLEKDAIGREAATAARRWTAGIAKQQIGQSAGTCARAGQCWRPK